MRKRGRKKRERDKEKSKRRTGEKIGPIEWKKKRT